MRVFDAALAEPEMAGFPIGSTLTDLLVIEFTNEDSQWGVAQHWLDRLRWMRARWLPQRRSEEATRIRPGQILVTSRASTPRIDDLILPVLHALSPDRCTVLYNDANVLGKLPPSTNSVAWQRAIAPVPGRWNAAFRRCWPQWRGRVRALCRSLDLPRGARERLGLTILVNSQQAFGARILLERCRPLAVVTDHDRARLPSTLVLAAKSLGIPTFTLQHGVLDQRAVGYVPVIADQMFCWGEMHRRILIGVGQDASKLAIGGCPRLNRQLAADPGDVRSRLGIPPSRRVVMLGTSPIAPAQRTVLAAWFSEAVSALEGVSGIVRLHPSEKLDFYAGIARKHPQIRFLDNSQASLDESLAASEVVVVHGSGLGSDALVKRRLAVVVDLPGVPLGHGQDLIEQAGCPRAGSAAELAAVLRRLLIDDEARRQQTEAGERFVGEFCAFYGEDSARRIADSILQAIDARPGRSNPSDREELILEKK